MASDKHTEVVDRWHVVCRDCPTEMLLDEDRKAFCAVRNHKENTGHRVDWGRV